jgi:hypothetical protein
MIAGVEFPSYPTFSLSIPDSVPCLHNTFLMKPISQSLIDPCPIIHHRALVMEQPNMLLYERNPQLIRRSQTGLIIHTPTRGSNILGPAPMQPINVV